ncbi:recombinase family protein [uncultured Gordonia sp.]|uniref:recombinase family protein n=1 Tax=uncultured Gordonia sp. TaxID=198437 RepID=UPI002583FE9E|nr:recombinase family protein [uncultured Gordonia sp.]
MRAVIYTRVSNDKSGHSRSTADQERECRAVCEQYGWTIGPVLTDADIGASRWSSKDRPAYRQLADTLQPGDVLVTWEASRAQRDLNAYVQLRDLCSQRGVQWCYSGRLYDLTSGDDRFTTGLDALLAEKEAEQIRERILRGNRSAALAGRPGGRTPYGYRPLRDLGSGRVITLEPDPERAPIVQEAARRVLAGEALNAVARDFTERDLPPPGKAWSGNTVKSILSSSSHAGLRTHQGHIVGDANWPAILSVADHHALVALFRTPGRRHTDRTGIHHLLSGIARCGQCGGPMKHFRRQGGGSGTYKCAEKSCIARLSEYVDDLVTETILADLETKTPADYAGDDPEAAAALREAGELRARLDAFTDQAADGSLSPAALARIEARLLPQIQAAESRAARRPSALPAELIGSDARATWDRLELADRRRIIRGLVTVTINRSTVGTRRFNPADIDIAWR